MGQQPVHLIGGEGGRAVSYTHLEETLRGLGLHLIPSCGACLSNMAVTPDGQVVPCQSWLGGTTLGNLLTDDWPTIWDGEACRAIRAKSAKLEHICQLGEGNREGC